MPEGFQEIRAKISELETRISKLETTLEDIVIIQNGISTTQECVSEALDRIRTILAINHGYKLDAN